MSGDELEQAATMWLRGWDTYRIASHLRVREATIYRNIDGIKARAVEIRRERAANGR